VRKDTAPAIKHPQKKEAININVIIIERLIQIVFIVSSFIAAETHL